MTRTWKKSGFIGVAFIAALLLLADTNAEVIVSIHAPAAAPGEITLASVRVNQAAGMAGGNLVIRTPDFISAAAPAETTPATADFLIASRSHPGWIEIALARAQGLADDQATLLQIPLRIAKTAPIGAFALAFDKVQLYDAQPMAISGKAVAASIEVLPAPADLDHDGLPDFWEMQYFGGIAGGPEGDADGDGFSNHEEFVAGTDPASSDSAFRITNLQVESRAGNRRTFLQWEGREGKNYEIRWSNGPVGPNMPWHPVYHPDIRKEGALLSWIDDGTRTHTWSQTLAERYYQIVIVSEPQ